MGDIPEINETLSQQDHEYIIQRLNEIEKKLAFTTTVPAKDILRLKKLGPKSITFVKSAFIHAEMSPEFKPPYVDIPRSRELLESVNRLKQLRTVIASLEKRLKDTAILQGASVLKNANGYYAAVRDAADRGIAEAEHILRTLKKTR